MSRSIYESDVEYLALVRGAQVICGLPIEHRPKLRRHFKGSMQIKLTVLREFLVLLPLILAFEMHTAQPEVHRHNEEAVVRREGMC